MNLNPDFGIWILDFGLKLLELALSYLVVP
jgi:hypothetical protein